jgi:hypothetical protein
MKQLHPRKPLSTNPDDSADSTSHGGKNQSRWNSLKHGCRSNSLLLPGEDPAEFEALHQRWLDQYRPKTMAATTLLDELVAAHWILKRTREQLNAVHAKVPRDPFAWTAEDHKQFGLFSRYFTNAERRFLRFYKELEAHENRLTRKAENEEQLRAHLIKMELDCQAKLKKVSGTIAYTGMAQAVTIEEVDGQPQAKYSPSNEALLKEARTARSQPLFVMRWLLFPKGVPAQYAWTGIDRETAEQDRKGIQRFWFDDWCELIKDEQAAGGLPASTTVQLSR